MANPFPQGLVIGPRLMLNGAMAIDLGPRLKSSIDDALHRAKMAWKAGKSEEAAANFESASELMFKFAEYAGARDLEYQRKRKAIEYRDYARRLRETASEENARARRGKQRVIQPGDNVPPPSDDPPPGLRHENISNKSTGEIASAVAAMVHNSPLTWDDIGGLADTKLDIKYTLGLSLAKPPGELKMHTFRNILFYGPPGTGKTILAAATSNALKSTEASATNAMFFNVKVSGVMSKYFGESTKIVSEIYGTARDNSPSVVFLDEFESITGKRGGDEQSGAERRILSTILSELDGLSEKGRGDIYVLTIAATNRPWDVDPAVLSRFEKRILIPLPDAAARKEILDILFTRRGFQTSANMPEVVNMTEGFSGRELERLAKEVTTKMIREMNRDLPAVVDKGLANARSYEVKIRPVSIDDWRAAISRITPATSSADMKRYLEWNDAADDA